MGRKIAAVRPHRRKIGQNPGVWVDIGRLGGDDAATHAIITLIRVPAALQSWYPDVRQGQMGRSNGKFQIAFEPFLEILS